MPNYTYTFSEGYENLELDVTEAIEEHMINICYIYIKYINNLLYATFYNLCNQHYYYILIIYACR